MKTTSLFLTNIAPTKKQRSSEVAPQHVALLRFAVDALNLILDSRTQTMKANRLIVRKQQIFQLKQTD